MKAFEYVSQISFLSLFSSKPVIPMDLKESNDEEKEYTYTTKIELKTGGNYGYTFRVMPKHEMLLDSANLNLIKWITK